MTILSTPDTLHIFTTKYYNEIAPCFFFISSFHSSIKTILLSWKQETLKKTGALEKILKMKTSTGFSFFFLSLSILSSNFPFIFFYICSSHLLKSFWLPVTCIVNTIELQASSWSRSPENYPAQPHKLWADIIIPFWRKGVHFTLTHFPPHIPNFPFQFSRKAIEKFKELHSSSCLHNYWVMHDMPYSRVQYINECAHIIILTFISSVSQKKILVE